MAPALVLSLGLVSTAGAIVAFVLVLGFGTSTKSVIRRRLRGPGYIRQSEKPVSRQPSTGSDMGLGALRFVIHPVALRKLERNLQLAGRSSTWRLSSIVALKLILPGGALIVVLLTLLDGISALRVLFAGVLLAVAYLLPDVIVRSRASERQQRILRDLPDVLDQVTISIESGMGFDGALARVGENTQGPLAEEIMRVVQDSRLGMSRRDAYQALADRTEVDDLRRFVKSIVQAEEFGVPMSQVVRTQAQELRTKRRQRAQESAQKVALKLLFPMLVCMFPVLFILILTPAMINLGQSL